MGLNHREPAPGGTRSALIPESFVEQIKERADLLKVVGRSVQLRKTGASYIGLCPFHNEKSPSFTVSPDKGFYKCFGCGAAGSALTFLMEHDGTPFRDAVKELAADVGLMLPAELTGAAASSEPAIDTSPIYRALELAAKYFSHVLRNTEPAKDYLKKRGMTEASLARFAIGMAPDEWRGLREAFPDYDTNSALLIASLIREKTDEASGRVNRYDFFRNRITFGVRDTRGRLIAFGGRILEGGGDPKYLNSTESPVFNKSGTLFGLFEARESIRAKKIVIVVEGYMDVVMLAQHGVQNAVASMGTAFTEAHAERLLTQSKCIVFAFDGDAAGRKAAMRALEVMAPMLEDSHDIRFLICPNGKDPDDLARNEGGPAFDQRCLEAPSLPEFLISEIALKNNGLRSIQDRAVFAKEASDIAGRISYTTKLRALVLAQITAQSQIQGAAIAALRQVDRNSRKKSTLWNELLRCVRIAPAAALLQRDVLIELLDTDDSEELALIDALKALVEGQAPDLAKTDDVLRAQDALAGCVELVTEHRERQLDQELRTRLASGELSQREYVKLSTAGSET